MQSKDWFWKMPPPITHPPWARRRRGQTAQGCGQGRITRACLPRTIPSRQDCNRNWWWWRVRLLLWTTICDREESEICLRRRPGRPTVALVKAVHAGACHRPALLRIGGLGHVLWEEITHCTVPVDGPAAAAPRQGGLCGSAPYGAICQCAWSRSPSPWPLGRL